MIWCGGSTVAYAPYYFDGMTFDEYFIEDSYYSYRLSKPELRIKEYKSLRKQLEDGDIYSIPEECKTMLPYPEKCTAYKELLSEKRATA